MQVFLDDTYFLEYIASNIVLKKRRERQEVPAHLQNHVKQKEGAEKNPFVDEVVGYYANLESVLFYGYLNERLSASGVTSLKMLQQQLNAIKADITKVVEDNGKKLKRYPKAKAVSEKAN